MRSFWRWNPRRCYARSWTEEADAVWQSDKILDGVVRSESAINVVRKVIAVVESHDAHVMSLRTFSESRMRRRKKEIIREVALRFPRIFKFRREVGEFWVELTDEVEEIMKREKRAIRMRDEEASVLALKKLLMMAKDHRLDLEKLGHLKYDFFFPDTIKQRLLPQHPESFKLVSPPGREGQGFVELVGWEPALAVTAREASASPTAPHAFAVDLRARPLDHAAIKQFQALSFVSPYQDPGKLQWRTLESQKRSLAVLHEVLSLMPMRKAVAGRLNLLVDDLRLPRQYMELAALYPWIFYVSKVIALNHTLFLREAFDGSTLKDRNYAAAAKEELLKLMDTVYERHVDAPPKVTLDVAKEDREDRHDFFATIIGNLRDF